MLNKMIKALEGARSELNINLSKVLQIQNSLNLASELLDEITINYSEVIFNENYTDEVLYGVIKANDNYWRFEHELDDEDLTEWLMNNEFKAMDSVQIFKIYNNFLDMGNTEKKGILISLTKIILW